MLTARVVYLSVSNGVPVTDRDEEREMAIDALLQHIDAIDKWPRLSSYPGEVAGDHGFITVVGQGFILHAYFVDEEDVVGNASVRFELLGPDALAPGSSAKQNGLIPVDGLKHIVRLLDKGESPVEYASANAVLPGDGTDQWRL